MEILKVENLSKVYGEGGTKVIALDNVSFSVEKRRVCRNSWCVRKRKIYTFTFDWRSR